MVKIIFYLLFFIPLILEGIGLRLMHEIVPYYYTILPSALFFYAIIEKKSLVFPRLVTIIYLIFILFSLISSLIFSVNKQFSFEIVLFYMACFLIFIFFYNHKKEGKKLISYQITIGGVIFIIYSLTLPFITKLNWSYLKIDRGYQFVLSKFNSHNHLGDFLGLTLILSLFFILIEQKAKYIFVFLISLVFFLFSFSRSAYVAFLPAIFVLLFNIQKKLPKIILIIFMIVSFLTGVFFLSTVREAQTSPTFKPFYTFLNQTVSLQSKSFLGTRPEYFNQGLKSFYANPLFGVGAGNFGSASRKYRSHPNNWTETAHNIFLEVLVENGLLAFIFFAGLILIVLKSAFNNLGVYQLLFFYMLLNFQTDYTYRIYSFFVIFIILMALVYEEEKTWQLKLFYPISALLLFLIVDLMFANYLLIK